MLIPKDSVQVLLKFTFYPINLPLSYEVYSLKISFMYLFISAPIPFLHLIPHL